MASLPDLKNTLTEERLTKTAYVLLAFPVFFILVIRAGFICSYSLDLDGIEFGFIRAVQRLMDHQPLYSNPESFPYLAVVYMPAYPYILYALNSLCGLNRFSDIHSLYVAARILSFVVVVLNLLVFDSIIKLFNKTPLTRLFCAALFLLLQSNLIFNIRPDAFQLLFFLLFLRFILRYFYFSSGRATLFYAIIFAMLSIFSKQDSVIAVFTLLGVLCLYQRTIKAFFVSAFFALALIVTLGISYLAFGPYFFTNTIIYNFQALTELKKTYVVIAIAYSFLRMLPLVLAVCYLAYMVINKHSQKRPGLFLFILAICYFIITHLTMLRAGSWINYSFPAVVLLVICVAALTNDGLPFTLKKQRLAYLFAGAYVAFLLLLNYLTPGYLYYSKSKEDLNRLNYYTLLQDKEKIGSITKNDTLFFLNNKPVVIFKDKPLVYGYDKHIDRLIEVIVGFHVHTKMLFVSSEKYDNLFNNGSIKFIIANDNEICKRQMQEYYQHYLYFTKIDNFLIYKYSG